MTLSTVKAVQGKSFDTLPPLRFGQCWAILAVTMLVAYLSVTTFVYFSRGWPAVVASTVAAAVCFLGSSLALAGTARFGRTGINGPMYTLAFGMVFNGALPFAVGFVLNRLGGSLAQSGVFGLVMIFFLFALVVETLLSICLIKSAR